MDGTLKLTGRDISETELALDFDPALGIWVITGKAAEVARSPERQEIMYLLRRHGPMTPVEVADTLGRNRSTVRDLLRRMKDCGEIRLLQDGKYIVDISYLYAT